MEGLEDVGPTFVADDDPPEAGEPCQGALDFPAVAAEPFAVFDAAARDAGNDGAPAAGEIIALVPLSALAKAPACSLVGRRRGRPAHWRMAGMASTVASSIRLSWTLAADRVTASGMPLASMTTWRLDPGLPRSVGFGPVSRPPFLPERWRCPAPPGSNQSHWPCPTGPEGHGAASPTPRRPASRADVASRSCPSRSPSPGAAFPTGCRFSERTGYRSAPPDHRPAADRLWDGAGAPEATAPRPPIAHR
jgi:hypothetical protein